MSYLLGMSKTIYRTCPTCCPGATMDFDRHIGRVYRCRNCGHERTLRKNKRGEKMTPSQAKALRGMQFVYDTHEVTSEMRGGLMIVRCAPGHLADRYISKVFTRRGKEL